MCGLGRGHAIGETMSPCFRAESNPYLLPRGQSQALGCVTPHALHVRMGIWRGPAIREG